MKFLLGGFGIFKSIVQSKPASFFSLSAILGMALLAVGCLHSPDGKSKSENPNEMEVSNETPVDFPLEWCYIRSESPDPPSYREVYRTFNRHKEIIDYRISSNGYLDRQVKVLFDEFDMPREKVIYYSNGDSVVHALESDSEGRITKILEPSGKAQYIEYDERGNMTSLLEDIEDDDIPEKITLYTYTDFDSIATKDIYENGDSNPDTTIAISFNADHQVLRIIETSYGEEGSHVKDQYYIYNEHTILIRIEIDNNGDGAIDGIEEYHGDIAVRPDFTYVLDDFGRVLQETYPYPMTITYNYDELGRLTRNEFFDNGVSFGTATYHYSCANQ